MDQLQPAAPAADSDAARYVALEKSLAEPAPEGPPPAPAKTPEPPAAAKPEEKKPDAPLPYEELDKRYKNLQGALGEARGETRQTKAQLQALAEKSERMERFLRELGQVAQQPPQDEDPYLAPVQRQLKTLEQQHAETARRAQEAEQALKYQAQQSQLERVVRQQEAEFAAKAPDYIEAVKFLRTSREQEYSYMLPSGVPQAEQAAMDAGFANAAAMRQAMIERDAYSLAQQAVNMGISPAEVAYNMAKSRGYAGRQVAPAMPAAPAQPQTRVETIRQGQQAASSLSNGAGGTPAEAAWPSYDELARMYVEDPDKAETLITKMKRAGVLQ